LATFLEPHFIAQKGCGEHTATATPGFHSLNQLGAFPSPLYGMQVQQALGFHGNDRFWYCVVTVIQK